MLPNSNSFQRLPRLIIGNALDRLLQVAEWILPEKKLEARVQLKIVQKKILILSIFANSRSVVEYTTLITLAESSGFYVIVINTGKNNLLQDRENVHVVNRLNEGRDFASYQVGLSLIEVEKKELIILMNDSMVWSATFLNELFECRFKNKKTIYGLTLSEQKSTHLQSYLLIFPRDVIYATKIFLDMQIHRFKRLIVKHGELGASRFWLQEGFSLAPITTTDKLIRGTLEGAGFHPRDKRDLVTLVRKKRPINPTIHCWPELFRLTGCIKKSLLYKNPAKLLMCPESLQEAGIMVRQSI
jgi:hypothetical protein